MTVRVVADPPHTGPGRCRRCGARILWCLTDNSKRMPVDAQATTTGFLVVQRDAEPAGPEDGKPHAFPPAPWKVSGRSIFESRTGVLYKGPLYTSHFATCPEANKHRANRVEKKAPGRQLSLLDGGKGRSEP